MASTTFYLYVRLYSNKGKLVLYKGITKDLMKRQQEHNAGLCRTTNQYNKSYTLLGVYYQEMVCMTKQEMLEIEKKFKRKDQAFIVNYMLSRDWRRW